MASPERHPFPTLLIVTLLTVSLADVVGAQKQTSKQSSGTAKSQTAELTPGERKAVAVSDKLEANVVVIFDKDGGVKTQQKVDPKRWESLYGYAAKICSGPVPISPKCVRCKNGEIICAHVSSRDREH
jgi:hypothetical protein